MTRARIRTLKPEVWQDEKVVDLSRDARLLFVGLITMADDEGRLRAPTAGILGHCFAYDDDASRKIKRWLAEIERAGLVLFYEVDGRPYGAFRHWRRHQRITRATTSTLPPPPDSGVVADNAVPDGPDGEHQPRPGPTGYKKKSIPERVRRAVARRYGAEPGEVTDAKCDLCDAKGSIHWPRLSDGRPGSWVQFSGLELDHIDPEFHGGDASEENIRLLCTFCNRSKGSRTPLTESSEDPSREPVIGTHGDPHAQARVPIRSVPIPSVVAKDQRG